MKHPSEATLALYAGQDLGAFARWRTARHLGGCERCRGEVARFSGLREEIAESNELPALSWNRLAAEMKANIRVGLAAGECIRGRAGEQGWLGSRALVACASVALLLLAGVWLERPVPATFASGGQDSISLRATGDGVELREGQQSLMLTNGPAVNVIYSAGAQGSMRARYVDPATGVVTSNTVYVQ